MTTDTRECPAAQAAGLDSDIEHVYCCQTRVAMCGTDLNEEDECLDPYCDHPPCVVCDDLADRACAKCGHV